MNYNNEKSNIEQDDMNIRSHLNASLDFNGISVSEDLINRTLQAVQAASQQQDNKQDIADSKSRTQRKAPWIAYARTFAGVAAAVLIFVAGYGLLNTAGNMKSDMNSQGKDSVAADMAKTTNEKSDSVEYAATGSTDDGEIADADAAQDEVNMTSLAESKQEEQEVNKSEADASLSTGEEDALAAGADDTVGSPGIVSDAIDTPMSSARPPQSLDRVEYLAFRDIFLTDPVLTQSVTVTDEVAGTFITLTSPEDISALYSVMDKYQFLYETDASVEIDYTIEIMVPDENEAVYTIAVGSSIIIDYTDKDISGHSIYKVQDSSLLLQDMKEFFGIHNK